MFAFTFCEAYRVAFSWAIVNVGQIVLVAALMTAAMVISLTLYAMTTKYLELATRTEVLNKRMDLMSELLRLLQHQHENAHSVKLEWIVIWLIFMSVFLEMAVLFGKFFDVQLE